MTSIEFPKQSHRDGHRGSGNWVYRAQQILGYRCGQRVWNFCILLLLHKKTRNVGLSREIMFNKTVANDRISPKNNFGRLCGLRTVRLSKYRWNYKLYCKVFNLHIGLPNKRIFVGPTLCREQLLFKWLRMCLYIIGIEIVRKRAMA